MRTVFAVLMLAAALLSVTAFGMFAATVAEKTTRFTGQSAKLPDR